MSGSVFVWAAIKIRSTCKDRKMSTPMCDERCVCVCARGRVYGGEGKGQYDRDMKKTKPPGHSRPSVIARCKALWQGKKKR